LKFFQTLFLFHTIRQKSVRRGGYSSLNPLGTSNFFSNLKKR